MESKQAALETLKARISALEAGPVSDEDTRWQSELKKHEGDACAAEDGEQQAFRKIMRLVAIREQCSTKLVERLIRDGFDADCACAAVEHAKSIGAVDDLRFAETYVRTRLAAGYGRAGMRADLDGWGIDPSATEELRGLLTDDGEAEQERALALLDRKPPRSRNQREGAFRRLMQRGYGASVSASAARHWVETHG